MIINSILNKEIPFKEVDCISAGELIKKGQRPSVSSIEREHKGWMSAISSWLKEDINERLSMNEFKGDMDRLSPGRRNVNEQTVERNQENNEIRKSK
jgi:hypothetical protein